MLESKAPATFVNVLNCVARIGALGLYPPLVVDGLLAFGPEEYKRDNVVVEGLIGVCLQLHNLLQIIVGDLKSFLNQRLVEDYDRRIDFCAFTFVDKVIYLSLTMFRLALIARGTRSQDSEDNNNNDIAVVKNELPLPAIFRDTDFNPDSDQHTENEENNTILANISHLNFKHYGKDSIAPTSPFQNHHLVGFLAKNPIDIF
ncbi:hypothetical protein FQR65_LT10345 [Abscondita terminalis]|nr:hypothetical protein FQR65_LT10345 [Abscondita terminalis]